MLLWRPGGDPLGARRRRCVTCPGTGDGTTQLTNRSVMAATQDSKPTRRRLSGPDRRAGILDAALTVFSGRGYHAASIDEIAQEAGISKALIYEHFPSKKDLHVSLLERHTQEIFVRLAETAHTDRPGEVRLRNGVSAFLEWVETHREAFRLLFRDTFELEVAEVLNRLQNKA